MFDKVYHGDCLKVLSGFPDECCHVIITDPPYGIANLDSGWNPEKVASTKNMKVVTSLPSGMRFDRAQGQRFREWYYRVSEELLRVLRPGGFFFSFSSPRLYHNMATAIEDAGFLVRDQFIWLYTQNQPKAMGLNHVIDRLNVDSTEKESLKEYLAGWKTPQVKSCHEPLVLGQKPLDGSFLENYRDHGVGLVNTNVRIGDGMFPSNVLSSEMGDEIDRYFLVSKPTKKEKGDGNIHKTVKPLELMQYLIALTTREGDVVLDPFLGSGTTAVAAKRMNRSYIGVELNQEYVTIAQERLAANEQDIRATVLGGSLQSLGK